MTSPTEHNDDRREFLKKAGTFAAVTPPAVTFLLSTSMSSQAIAKSGGGPRGNYKKGKSGGNPQPHGHGDPHARHNDNKGHGKSHTQYNPGHGHGHG